MGVISLSLGESLWRSRQWKRPQVVLNYFVCVFDTFILEPTQYAKGTLKSKGGNDKLIF